MEISEYSVTMSNVLTRASHGLTLTEKRVIASCIAKTDSRKGANSHAHLSEFEKIRITADEYAEAFEVAKKTAYLELAHAAKYLIERYYTIKTSDGIDRYNWLSHSRYASGEGYIEISFTKETYPHLHALKSQYTTYKLRDAANLKTAYAWRLYEIARSWKEHAEKGKSLILSLDNFAHQMTAPGCYKWNDIKKRILTPAIEEIFITDNLKIEYELIKNGRAVTALKFSFSKPEKSEK